jgi:MFS family permease
MTMGVVVGSSLSGMLAAHSLRVRWIFLWTCPFLVLATFLLAALTRDMPTWLFIAELCLAGVAASPAFPLSALAVQNSVEPRVIGQATALTQFTRQIGSAAGSAVLGAILASAVARHGGRMDPGAYVPVMRGIFLVSGVLAALSWAAAWLLPDVALRGRAVR